MQHAVVLYEEVFRSASEVSLPFWRCERCDPDLALGKVFAAGSSVALLSIDFLLYRWRGCLIGQRARWCQSLQSKRPNTGPWTRLASLVWIRHRLHPVVGSPTPRYKANQEQAVVSSAARCAEQNGGSSPPQSFPAIVCAFVLCVGCFARHNCAHPKTRPTEFHQAFNTTVI